ncbi:MAG: hypothetical protein GXP16_15560 [Gammaproteobacteria bacterium]|nr:hypothetical protein [Gammaproteobacteria bacterium]
MTHPSHLQLSMHADKALSADQAIAVTQHLELCPTCQTRMAAVRDEARFIVTALQIEATEEPWEVTVPKFSRPLSLRGFALANLGTGLVIWLAQFLWKTLFGELIVNATTWVTSIYVPDIYAMVSATALYLLEEGTTMLDAYLGFVIVSLLTITVLGFLLMYRKTRSTMGVCFLVIMVGTTVTPTPANALEIRRDKDVVTINKSETINDTLFVAAETVLIEGVITGDLVAMGRRIDISGSVEGNVLTFAESVTLSGKVGGFALGAASSYDLHGATVGGDLWAAGENVDIDDEARVGRNAIIATQTATVKGSVKKDLFAFAETVELSGVLGEDLEAFATRVKLLGDAHVGGNVRFRSGNEDRLHRAENVRIDGDVEFLDMPEEFEDKSRYATVEFYLWQVARLIAAFLVGLAFVWFVPGYRSVSIGAGVEALKTAGVGFLIMVSVPIMAVLVAFTLVGLPLSFIAVAAWLLCLYLAKIVVGAVVGRMLLSQSDSLAWTLLAGLSIVIVAVNLPFIGGIINVVLTIVGLGLIAQKTIAKLASRDSGDLAAT